MTDQKKKLTYQDAGVSIKEGDALVERLAKSNKNIGGFSGAFPLPLQGYEKPMLLAATDGVGTKLLLAQKLAKLDTIGIDLVAMVINDLAVCGALPLFFLDYYATGRLDAAEADAIISGINRGCEISNIPLLGGETAEMPGLYSPGHFDLAGFAVGLVDESNAIDGSQIGDGDVVIGIASSGVHSNGYSLVRAVIDHAELDIKKTYEGFGNPLGEVLLEPTIIYSPFVQELLKQFKPNGMCHITGGGLQGNLIRVLSEGHQIVLDRASWSPSPLFGFLQEQGNIDTSEMFDVFNMGIGYVVIVPQAKAGAVQEVAKAQGLESNVIGRVQAGDKSVIFSDEEAVK